MKYAVLAASIACATEAPGQAPDLPLYDTAFLSIQAMLEGRADSDLQHAIFLVENAYVDGGIDEVAFNEAISAMTSLAQAWSLSNPLKGYTEDDSVEFAKWRAAFHVMTDTTFIAPGVPLSLPLAYDTVDYFGIRQWESTFVSQLLATGIGNCHSLPLLYKLICERMGVEAYLALVPNHMYIKQKSKKHGWFNTDLTSSSFPDDAWLMATGYVSAASIRSGLYMATLGLNETLALCLTDLVYGYERKSGIRSDPFIMRCCDLALRYHPVSVHALILKVNALSIAIASSESNEPDSLVTEELNRTASLLVKLDYREVPLEVYQKWIAELASVKGRFQTPAKR